MTLIALLVLIHFHRFIFVAITTVIPSLLLNLIPCRAIPSRLVEVVARCITAPDPSINQRPVDRLAPCFAPLLQRSTPTADQ